MPQKSGQQEKNRSFSSAARSWRYLGGCWPGTVEQMQMLAHVGMHSSVEEDAHG